MHRFTPKWPTDHAEWEPPSFFDGTYRDAFDVVEDAAYDPLTTWYTYPWLWHLDESGRPHCTSKGSSFCDVQTFAARLEEVLATRITDTGDTCPDYWFIIESRQTWRERGDGVDEADVAAFVSLRRSLSDFGITLLDDIVVNERFEWWSLHELTSGTTAWDFTPSHATRHLSDLDLYDDFDFDFDLDARLSRRRRRSA